MGKFYLGMDIGTNSVGMACADENYNLLRAKGKDLWSVRLFKEAESAENRRVNRTARRRLQRRRQRIELLQGIFAPYMSDNLFFIRLNDSGFCEEDKRGELKSKYSLFADDDYCDADFYKKFPTVFHLRKALFDGEKLDLRHYYLAICHIIKYRGHFLFEGEDLNAVNDVKKLLCDYNVAVGELNDGLDDCIDLTLPVEIADSFKAISLKAKGVNDKKKALISELGVTSPEKKELLALLSGASVKPAVIFNDEKYKGEKLSFKTLTDETLNELSDVYSEECFAVLEKAKAIYDFMVFEKVLNGADTISNAMVAIYDKHKSDLKLLKSFIKNNCSLQVYDKIFRSETEKNNYVNYVGHNKVNKSKSKVEKCKSPEDFFKFISKIIKEVDTDDEATKQAILSDVENGNFLPKILYADNGLFPHQINGYELNGILKNLCRYYPEFTIKSPDGYSAAEKIKKIFSFKIPYYVGPLNATSKNAWLVRKSNEKITPWNFDDVVDKAASNENFIRRMTNKCSYLHNQDVLPKSSMYYQAFDVLNQINKLTIGGAPISVELKQEIFNNLYLKYKKVTAKNIENYLVANGKLTKKELLSGCSLGGFDVEVGLKANMNSYVTFKSKFGSLVDERPDVFENVILQHTLNTDKSIVKDVILQRYGEIIQIKENIEWIKSLTSFKEFGRLSKKLIVELVGGADDATGEAYTFLNRLYHTNLNFNQLYHSGNYAFEAAVTAENLGESQEINYDSVKELYVSPMVRRGIWQALKMVDEYVAAVGKAPDKIFIETTRSDGDKLRTISRKNNLLKLYDGLGTDCYNLDKLREQLNREDMTDSRLRQERLYLYFLQLGRCAYTGEIINLDDVCSTKLYDVDHIVPRSLTKDDSLDNKVLVKREKNAQKTDVYPLPEGFSNQKPFWKMLKDKKLISETKYNRLTRIKPLSYDDFNEFVNRQMVVTNQTIKAVAELLSIKFKKYGTKIVYSKAKNVDDFKQKFSIVKCRETNDLHHARDAYLNVVVGNVYDTKFTSAKDYYYRKPNDFWREYNLKNLFNYPVENAWAGADDVAKIKRTLEKTSMSVTRLAFVNGGKFFDATVLKKGDRSISLPLKDKAPYTQTDKYGGYTKLATAYFTIVKSKKKGKTVKTIEAIPIVIDYKSKNDKNAVINYLIANGIENPEIIVDKLKIQSLVSINGFKAYVAGMTGDRIILHNACQWYTDAATDLYVKNVTKYVELDRQGKISEDEKLQENIPLSSNRNGVTLYADKINNIAIYLKIINTLNKNAYNGVPSVTSFNEKLQKKQAEFEALSTFKQMQVLLQIIRFMKCNAESADLTLLNEGSRCGILSINKNITDVNFKIINSSACGLTTKIKEV